MSVLTNIANIYDSSIASCDGCNTVFSSKDFDGYRGVQGILGRKRVIFCPLCFECNFCGTAIHTKLNPNIQCGVTPILVNSSTFERINSVLAVYTLALLSIHIARDSNYIFTNSSGKKYDINENESDILELLDAHRKLEVNIIENVKIEASNYEIYQAYRNEKQTRKVVMLPTLDKIISSVDEGIYTLDALMKSCSVVFTEVEDD